ncbi:hypothetical protein Tco_0915104 [Tanacetum coccineum]
MILSRPFLATIHAEIDIFNKENSLGIGDDKITFDMDKKIYNFATLIRKVYMVKSIQNDESSVLPDVSSTTPSIESRQVEKSRNLGYEVAQDTRVKRWSLAIII